MPEFHNPSDRLVTIRFPDGTGPDNKPKVGQVQIIPGQTVSLSDAQVEKISKKPAARGYLEQLERLENGIVISSPSMKIKRPRAK